MASPIAFFLALTLAAAVGGQSAQNNVVEQTRARIEGERPELLADIADPAWMKEPSHATLARLRIERNWKLCATNEAAALAQASAKPARLLAEAALVKCRAWEQALTLAMHNGANPYLDERISNEDFVTLAELQSRDAALASILRLRGVSTGSSPAAPPASPAPGPTKRDSVPLGESIMSQRAFPVAAPPAPQATPAPAPASDALPGEDVVAITVVGQRQGGCRVRLADRTLTDSQLAESAKRWAADGTRLRVIQPHGADYACLTRIVTHLGEYGVRLFEFVDP